MSAASATATGSSARTKIGAALTEAGDRAKAAKSIGKISDDGERDARALALLNMTFSASLPFRVWQHQYSLRLYFPLAALVKFDASRPGADGPEFQALASIIKPVVL